MKVRRRCCIIFQVAAIVSFSRCEGLSDHSILSNKCNIRNHRLDRLVVPGQLVMIANRVRDVLKFGLSIRNGLLAATFDVKYLICRIEAVS